MAINKPNNYENIQIGGDFTPVNLGGHHLVVMNVREQQSKSGKDMIVVSFDFSNKDEQAGYFTQAYNDDIRADKKWPHQATQYIMTEDTDGNCSRGLKTFITCVENSNPGFEPNWGENFCASFKGKELGGVFGEVESEYNGKINMRNEMRWFISAEKVADANIPDAKYLANKSAAQPTTDNGFVNIPDGMDGELPFN